MKKRHVQLLIGIAISLFFLYMSFRKVDFGRLWETLKTIKYVYAIPFVGITMFSMYLRAVRWKYFLLPNYKFSSKRLFSPLIIGFALNGLFPGRVGEFARPYVLYRKDNVPFPVGLATVVIERIFDGVIALMLFAISLYILPPFDPKINIVWDNTKNMSGAKIITTITIILAAAALFSMFLLYMLKPSDSAGAGIIGKLKNNPKLRARAALLTIIMLVISLIGIIYLQVSPPLKPDMTYKFGKAYNINGATLQLLTKNTTYLIFILIAGVILMMINKTRNMMQAIMMKIPLIPLKVKQFTLRIMEHFAEGLSSLQNIRYIFWIVLHSFLVWGTVGVSLWVMGLGFSNFPLSISGGMVTMVIIGIAITIPAAPGYWGIYEYGCIFALKALNVTQDDSVAMGFSLIIHAGQMIPIIIVGLFYLLREQISIQEFSSKPASAKGK